MFVPFIGRSPAAEEDMTGSAQLLHRHYEIILKAAVMFVARGARYRVSSGLECRQVAPGRPGIGLTAFVVSRMASQATRAGGRVLHEYLEGFCMA